MTDQTLKDIDRAFKALEKRDELLDKLRVEIINNAKRCMNDTRASGLYMAVNIIDRYRNEVSK